MGSIAAAVLQVVVLVAALAAAYRPLGDYLLLTEPGMGHRFQPDP